MGTLIPSRLYGPRMTYKISEDAEDLYEFSPVPMINCSRQVNISGVEETGDTITISFSGNLVAPRHIDNDGIRPIDDNTQFNTVIGDVGLNVLDNLKKKLERILSVPGGEFRIFCKCDPSIQECDGDIEYFRIYPNAITNLEFRESGDNWTQTIPYTFQMIYHRTNIFRGEEPLYLENISEDWSIEEVNLFPNIDDLEFSTSNGNTVLQLTHTLSATGKKVYGKQIGPYRQDEIIHQWKNIDFVGNATGEGLDTQYPDGYTRVNTNETNIKRPYDYAKKWIETKLRGVDRQNLYSNASPINEFNTNDFFYLDQDGIFNYNTSLGRAFNHTRQKSGNETNGTYSVTETWTIILGPLSDYGATDEYTIDYRYNNEAIESISIQGTIQGYQIGEIDEKELNDSKIKRAELLLEYLLKNQILLQRCDNWLQKMRRQNLIGDAKAFLNRYIGDVGDISDEDILLLIAPYMQEGSNPRFTSIYLINNKLNTLPITKSFSRQVISGIITYSFEYNTRCENLLDDTLSESITVQMNYPTDVFGQVTIPGRQRGPIIFSANTYTAPTLTINMELVMKPTECTDNTLPIESRIFNNIIPPRDSARRILRIFYNYIRDIGGDIVKIQSDSDNWDIIQRRYSANFTFLFSSCHSSDYLRSVTRLFYEEDREKERVKNNNLRLN